jgi:hypothetical protein
LHRIGIPLLANCASPAAPQLFVSAPERVCRNTITTIFASCTLFHLVTQKLRLLPSCKSPDDKRSTSHLQSCPAGDANLRHLSSISLKHPSGSPVFKDVVQFQPSIVLWGRKWSVALWHNEQAGNRGWPLWKYWYLRREYHRIQLWWTACFYWYKLAGLIWSRKHDGEQA